MNIIVAIKQVPDLVEELEINAAGTDLDREWLKMKLSEFDDHAMEEALLMKDDDGANVTAIALASDDIDKALYAAAAKGADKLIKVTGVEGSSTHEAAKAMANVIKDMDYDIIMTGVQAVDDRDGQLAVLLAHYLGVPHISVVTGVVATSGSVTVLKEYGGGMVAEFEASTPVVLGIQAARETPRYVPVAKVRRAMKGSTIDEVSAGNVDVNVGSTVTKMYKPDSGSGAEMIGGSAEDQANKILEILTQKGIK